MGDDPRGEAGWCLLEVGGDDLGWLALRIAHLGLEAQVLDPPALREAAAALADGLRSLAEQ